MFGSDRPWNLGLRSLTAAAGEWGEFRAHSIFRLSLSPQDSVFVRPARDSVFVRSFGGRTPFSFVQRRHSVFVRRGSLFVHPAAAVRPS
ncbi:hypothetical protein SDJN03_00773, partial [Cucurbita argyrosperma subsp. sororia]